MARKHMGSLPEGQIIEFENHRVEIAQCINTSGATGEIYEGYLLQEEGTQVHVAIKAMRVLEHSNVKDIFDREALVLSLLNMYERNASEEQRVNLKVAPYFYFQGEYRQDDKKLIPYIVMEFIEGRQIVSLLADQGRLPENEALALGWQFYWLLDMLHTRLKMAYRDLKFENLWRVKDNSGNVRLKVTDLGGLEEIPEGTPQRERSIKRDLLLAGVYLCAMLTGYTPAYNYGQLSERVEPIVQGNQTISWGARWVLRWILHRNPEARPKNASEVANELRNLAGYWQRPDLLSVAQRLLDEAEKEVEEDFRRSRLFAARARAALDIAERRDGLHRDDWAFSSTLERAEKMLSSSGYLTRGVALLRGGSFADARRIFEEGRASADEPEILRRWSYLAAVGEEVGLTNFSAYIDEAIQVIEKLNQGDWSAALERLNGLRTMFNAPTLDALIADCRLYQLVEQAETYVRQGKFSEAARIYREANQNLEQLPEVDRRLVQEEEVGDLRARAEELDLLARTREQARERMKSAASSYLGGDVKRAIELAQEAFHYDRESDDLLNALGKLAERALQEGHLSEAVQLAKIGLRAPSPDARFRAVIRLGTQLLDAQEALESRKWGAFGKSLAQVFSEMRRTDLDLSQTTASLVRQANEVARTERALEALDVLENLRSSGEGYLNSELLSDLQNTITKLRTEHQERLRQAIQRMVEEATILLNLDEPTQAGEVLARYPTLAEVLEQQRRKAERLKRAEELLREAEAIAPPNDPAVTQIDHLKERIRREQEALKDDSQWLEREKEQKEEERRKLLQEWEDIQRALREMSLSPVTPEERAGKHKEMAARISDLIRRCYVYLEEVGHDAEISNLLEQSGEVLRQFGPRGLRQLQEVIEREREYLDNEIQGIRRLYEGGEVEQALLRLTALEQQYGSHFFALEDGYWIGDLKSQLMVANGLRKRAEQLGEAFRTGEYYDEIVEEMRNYARAGHYQDQSLVPYLEPFTRYLKGAEQRLREKIEATAHEWHRKQIDRSEALGTIATLLAQWLKTGMVLRQIEPAGISQGSGDWYIDRLLEDVYRIAKTRRGQAKRLAKLLATLPIPPDLDGAIAKLTPYAFSQAAGRVDRQQQRVRRWAAALVGSVATLLVCGIVFFLTYPPVPVPPGSFAAELDELLHGTYTPSPTSSPTSTPTPTATGTSTPTPTFTPSATPTLLPAGGRVLISPDEIVPPAPITGPFMQLLTYENAEVSPPFSDIKFWGSAQSLGGIPYYYTLKSSKPGQAHLSWQVGQLDAGLYQIYVLDTFTSSVGEHAFQVRLGGMPVNPVRGMPRAFFASSETEPKQQKEAWLSIGAYQVAYGQYMTVAAAFDSLAHPYFSASQLLVIRLRQEDARILGGLPAGRPLEMLLDDTYVEIRGTPSEKIEDPEAWNGSYQLLDWDGTEPTELTFTWEGGGVIPPGQYELLVHLLPSAEDVSVKYTILSAGKEAKPETPREDSQSICRELPNACSEGWASWGIWEIKQEGGVSVQLTALSPGRIIVDAVALVRVTDLGDK